MVVMMVMRPLFLCPLVFTTSSSSPFISCQSSRMLATAAVREGQSPLPPLSSSLPLNKPSVSPLDIVDEDGDHQQQSPTSSSSSTMASFDEIHRQGHHILPLSNRLVIIIIIITIIIVVVTQADIPMPLTYS